MAMIFKNARIFSPSHSPATEGNDFAECMVIKKGQIVHVGSLDAVDVPEDATIVDLQNKIVMPGFIDGHVHILQYGLSLRKVDLIKCTSLEQIRELVKSYADTHPSVPRILCRGWIQSMVDGEPLAIMLDDIDPRPIYIEAADLHSTWCSTAALDEMQAHTTPDPPGGTIHRDKNGRASGLLSEGAVMNFVWPFLERATSKEHKLSALRTAIRTYSAAGYTGIVDMAMSEDPWEILNLYRRDNKIPFHIAVHWLVPFSYNQEDNFKYVDRAIELRRQFPNPDFHIAGIKLMCDGVVDGCTAALRQPYGGNLDPIEPIWPSNLMSSVIQRADTANLQVAIHAIGDQAVHQSISILSTLPILKQRRHRIEHLELTSPADAKRLGELGITASVQPVHSDPAHFKAWPNLIGKDRCKRAFAYKDFLDGGAIIAIGTDAPTAPHFPFENLYSATTRRSVVDPGSTETLNPEFGLELVQAVAGATEGAAYARFADGWTGRLEEGLSADFVVVDMQWGAGKLLEAKVCQTWYRGVKVFDVDDDVEVDANEGSGS
ncbi:amidohydrolase 3 [Aspergillus cavernicola]|uniref:Amidohydrolase 3 n=1 Tax=Aspergillus cavernicola TaxID=176166 RepID=A0ABR4HAL1_9EURO